MDAKSGLYIKVLGCGDAFGNSGRFNTSFYVSDGKTAMLLDCGASTLIRLKQERINLDSISTIVLTHFHGDHFAGIPFFLISCLYENLRKPPLQIVGPRGVEERVHRLMEAMYPATLENLSSLDLQFIEYESGAELDLGSALLLALPVKHSPPSSPHGIRLTWQDRIIAYSGDTSWTEALLTLSKDADVFICECNFLDKRTSTHLCYEELVEKEEFLQCRQMFLTHMSEEVIQSPNVKMARLRDGETIYLE